MVDPERSFTTSFGGIRCAQYHIDLLLWERLLNTNPQAKGIVELGTWQGGFSWFLWAQCQARGMWFRTFDIIQPDREPPEFERLDFYRYPDRIRELVDHEPVVLFCDGGNKPRELREFAPMCAEGSVVVAHDWGTETLPTDVPAFLEELYGDYCDELGSITRVFRMKEENNAGSREVASVGGGAAARGDASLTAVPIDDIATAEAEAGDHGAQTRIA